MGRGLPPELLAQLLKGQEGTAAGTATSEFTQTIHGPDGKTRVLRAFSREETHTEKGDVNKTRNENMFYCEVCGQYMTLDQNPVAATYECGHTACQSCAGKARTCEKCGFRGCNRCVRYFPEDDERIQLRDKTLCESCAMEALKEPLSFLEWLVEKFS